MDNVNNSNKDKVAKQFSRAASQYDQHADVQADIARVARHYMQPLSGSLLDIGCGSGRETQALLNHSHHVIAIDIAQGMIDFAQSQYPTDKIRWLVGDAEALPLSASSVDSVFSSMALQWCESSSTAMEEIYRVLAPGGKGVVAVMTHRSFHELELVWRKVDTHKHVNDFATAEHWLCAAGQAGLLATADSRSFITYHKNVRSLLQSIKKIGANVKTGAGAATLSKTKLLQLEEAYQTVFRNKKGLPLTYHVTFLSLHKPG
ncbi:methyltransferase domain-containing protein [Aestuariibacter sp. AA17]|uniref:Malonyl-[acyl-carrier protein] O-methyltransferase n=1 Tax=Fluctibacter corallii TaxID=2984329 RepID=A0ABT3ABD1_9ALTE|nr:methyltransferase domain-containing protein [Aestuariibacter sp. AA17]MCV2885989.1 methyltransferase domain-containing protein [Aestuariibacter sp. AA17]